MMKQYFTLTGYAIYLTSIPLILSIMKCHGLVQFLEEEGKVAALRLNKKQYDSYSLSVLPSKFPALNEAPKASGYYGPNSDKADNHSEELAPEEVKR